MINYNYDFFSWNEAIIQLEQLLNLRKKSGQNLYIPELRTLIKAVSGFYDQNEKTEETFNANTPIAKALNNLLENCALAVPGERELWDLIAVWAEILGDLKRMKESRLKQVFHITGKLINYNRYHNIFYISVSSSFSY